MNINMLYGAAGGFGIGVIGVTIGMPALYIFTFAFIWGLIVSMFN